MVQQQINRRGLTLHEGGRIEKPRGGETPGDMFNPSERIDVTKVSEKICQGCDRLLPATREFFSPNNGSLLTGCKECRRTLLFAARAVAKKRDRLSDAATDPKFVERFWELTEPEPNTGCWLWLGRPGDSGYGNISHRYAYILAHRMSWQLAHGSPGALCVLHRCDTPLCVNPDHLFLGTRYENNKDRVSKGRSGGKRQPYSRLTREKVVQIRSLYDPGKFGYAKLGKKFDVSRMTVRDVIKRRTWRHVE